MSHARPTLPYWAPMILFGVMTVGETYVPLAWYPYAYAVKALLVTAALVAFREPLADIKLDARLILPSIAVGLVVCVLWVTMDEYLAYPRIGSRQAFDPRPLEGSSVWAVFLGVRLYGLVLMVPVMEEMFWRSFLLRYLTHHDFRRLPVGTFSASALAVVTLASAIAHPEWPVALVASLAYAFWLRSTRSLFGTIVAHAATNAALGGYVLATGKWQYW